MSLQADKSGLSSISNTVPTMDQKFVRTVQVAYVLCHIQVVEEYYSLNNRLKYLPRIYIIFGY